MLRATAHIDMALLGKTGQYQAHGVGVNVFDLLQKLGPGHFWHAVIGVIWTFDFLLALLMVRAYFISLMVP